MYTKFAYDTIRRVTIVNSDTRVGTEFTVATKQLEHLAQLASEVRAIPEPWGEGVDSDAVVGMGIIFESIPQKFPVQDLLNWLRDSIDPKLSTAVVEAALTRLARLYAV